MKHQFVATFRPEVYPAVAHNRRPITRDRMAYLLRAARSRRANNVERIGKIGYHIFDANCSLSHVA